MTHTEVQISDPIDIPSLRGDSISQPKNEDIPDLEDIPDEDMPNLDPSKNDPNVDDIPQIPDIPQMARSVSCDTCDTDIKIDIPPLKHTSPELKVSHCILI